MTPALTGTNATVACPVCGSRDTVKLGPPRFRTPARVAGVPVRIEDLGLRHWRCRGCTYWFQYPPIPAQRLIDCYQAAAAGNWVSQPSHEHIRSFARKRRLLERYAPPGRRVLDLGCFDGGFLRYLSPGWDVSGVEPSRAAADVARRHGVRILGPTIESVGPEYDATFDAIVVFDVMEHLTDPVRVLREVRRLLAPGGVVLIETGDANAPHWRLAGRDYWYSGIVEHVGFFNKRSIARAGLAAGMPLAHFERSIHSTARLDPRAQLLAPFVLAGYYALRALRALGVPLRGRAGQVAAGTAPTAIGAWDHFLAVLRKAPSDAPLDVSPGASRLTPARSAS
jgi:SAM-dependent methyltransferase